MTAASSHRFVILPPRIISLIARTGQFLNDNAVERPWLRRAALILATMGFAAGIALSLKSSPDVLHQVNWAAVLVLALVATPATLALNAIEFSFSARQIGQRVPPGRALSVTIIGSAANMLPIPGAMLVRLAALKAEGATLRLSVSMTALLALISIGVGLAYSGIWAVIVSGTLLPFAAVAAGLVACVAAFLVALQMFTDSGATIRLILIRLALTALDAARTYLAFAAIGSHASFGQASVLSIAAVLAAIITIVPAGLGVGEGIAALMAPLVGLTPAAAFLAASLSRIVGLSVVMTLTLLLTARRTLRSER